MRLTFAFCLTLALATAAPKLVLPGPTGPYPVGRQMLLWSDPSRLEDLGPQAGKPREIAAFAFYPAMPSGERSQYYPGLAGLESAPETQYLRRQFGAAWNDVTTGNIGPSSFNAPRLAAGDTRFPVLLFSPGGLAPALGYQLQLEELASRGYIIFALEHGTDSALIIRPDHTLLPYFRRRPPDNGPPTTAGLEADRDQVIRGTADMLFAIDQIAALAERADSPFHHRLDLNRIGVFGHSEGGKIALRACQFDSRIRACLNQDGEMFNQPLDPPKNVPTVVPSKPTLAPTADIFVNEPSFSDAQLASVGVTRKQFEDWRTSKNGTLRAFLGANTEESFLITITAPGFVHGSFMDARLFSVMPSPETAKNLKTAIDLTRAFFDHYLHTNESTWPPTERGDGIRIERLDAKR